MRNLTARILLAWLVALVAAPASAGSLAGKIVLVQDGKARADASNAVVWIEGLPRAGADAKAQMKSSSKRFEPHVVAVSKNGTVDFPNVDSIYHNVFSVSGGNRFDLGLYRSGASKAKRFDEAGLVRVYCNIHPQMVGFVMVVDSGYVAVTGPDGSFRFDNVPAGSHTVKAWHEEGKEGADVSLPVTVRSGGEPPVSLSIDVSATPPPPHKNKYGKDYKPPTSESEDERY